MGRRQAHANEASHIVPETHNASRDSQVSGSDDCLPLGLQQLRAVWSRLSASQRVCAITFDRQARIVAIICSRVITDLNSAVSHAAGMGFGVAACRGVSNLALVPAVEFTLDPEGQADRPLAMTFGTELVMRLDFWEALERASPNWGRNDALPRAKWALLLKPMPSSWLQFESVLAALLEQRLIEFMNCIYASATQTVEYDRIEQAEVQAKRRSARASRRLARRKIKTETMGRTNVQRTADADGSALDASHRCEKIQLEEADGSGTSDNPAIEDCSDENMIGPHSIASTTLCMSSHSDDVGPFDQSPSDWQNSNTWQLVGSRGRPTKQKSTLGDTLRIDSEVQSPDPQSHAISGGRMVRAQFENTSSQCSARFEHFDAQDEAQFQNRDAVHAMCPLDNAQARANCLPDHVSIGKHRLLPDLFNCDRCTLQCDEGPIALDWRAADWGLRAVEACRHEDGNVYRACVRKENASWRLWHMERQHKFSAKLLDEPICTDCAQGIGMGRVCTCRSESWQTNTPALPQDAYPPSRVESVSDCDQASSELSSLQSRTREDSEVAAVSAHWRRLLRNAPPGLTPSSSHADAARRRHENSAWRLWWTAHQSNYITTAASAGLQLFPLTPTSTFPGTPHATFPSTPRDSATSLPEASGTSLEGGLAASQMQHATDIVYWPVPLRILPQVQYFIEHLLRNEGSSSL